MIEFIFLDRNSELKKYEIIGTETYLTNLSKFNIFIGPNNSGKSRLIRNLFKLNGDLNINAHPIDWTRTRKNTIRLIDSFERKLIKVFDKQEVTFLKLKEFEEIKENINSDTNRVNLFSVFQFRRFLNSIEATDYMGGTFPLKDFLRREINPLNDQLNSFIEGFQPLKNNKPDRKFSFLYIPVLRGLRPIQSNGSSFGNQDNYLERTIYDYFEKNSDRSKTSSKGKFPIFSGLSLYGDVTKLLLGDEEQRATIREFEQFLAEKIFQKTVTLIPRYKDDVLHIKIGDSPQLEVYNLGDGIQALITLLFPIFIRKDEHTLIFIEEPEIHLHPHWQRRFIDALSQFDKHQYFITTHSNIFINLQDSSIFKVRTEESEDKTYISYLNLRAEKIGILNDLGYKASDLLQTNFVLWVEGPSDAIYFNCWISKIDSTLQEGIHYTIMYYSGNNLDVLLKENRLVGFGNININFGFYIDSDKSKKRDKISDNKQKIIDFFKEHADFCWISEKREIENYIPLDTFKQAVEAVHKNSKTQIEDGDYWDRTKLMDLNSKSSPKAKIKIPQYLMTEIQKNKGQIHSIPIENLRKGIQEALDQSAHNTIDIKKTEVAKKVVELSSELKDKELNKKINELVSKIRKANNL